MGISCFACKKLLAKSDVKHIYHCSEIEGSLSRDHRYLQQMEHTLGIKISRDMMVDLYVEKCYSIPDLFRSLGMSNSHVYFLLDYYGIPKRTPSESAKKITSKKQKEYFQKAHGVDNVSQLESIKEQKKATFLKNYGVDNIFKHDSFFEKRDTKMREKYGQGSVPDINGNANAWGWIGLGDVEKQERLKNMKAGEVRWWCGLTEEEKCAHIQRRSNAIVRHYNSGLELRVMSLLSNLDVKFRHQYWVTRRSYDFNISGTRLLIEINGDYWHVNPSIYKPDDLITRGGVLVTAQSLWDKDADKIKIAEKWGYHVATIWEKDMRSMDDTKLSVLLLNIISTYHEKRENKGDSPDTSSVEEV